MSYQDVDYDYFKNLRMCENAFRSFQTFHDESIHIWNKPYTSEEQVKSLSEKSRDKMLEAWEWYGDNVMNPATLVLPDRDDDSIMKKMGMFARDVAARAKGGFAGFDMKDDFIIRELRLYSDLLGQFARMLHGHPENYHDSDDELDKKPDDWADRQCLALMMHNDGFSDYYMDRNEEEGWSAHKHRKDIGLDFCAWFEDILNASQMLETYADWIAPSIEEQNGTQHKLTLRESFMEIDPDSAALLDTEIRSEFMNVWMWIGKNILTLWD